MQHMLEWTFAPRKMGWHTFPCRRVRTFPSDSCGSELKAVCSIRFKTSGTLRFSFSLLVRPLTAEMHGSRVIVAHTGKEGLESWVEISFSAFPSTGAHLLLSSFSANAAVLVWTKSYQLGALVCRAKDCRIWPLQARAKSLQFRFWV